MRYDYRCPAEGIVVQDEGPPQDTIQCRCGSQAKRIRSFAVNKASLRSEARWDPVVGAFVNNDREFRELLKAGQERNSAETGMDTVLETVDARDNEGLAELHGTGLDHRLEVAEQMQKVNHDAQAVI